MKRAWYASTLIASLVATSTLVACTSVAFAHAPEAERQPPLLPNEGEIRIILSGYAMPADSLAPSVSGGDDTATGGEFALDVYSFGDACGMGFGRGRPLESATISWRAVGRVLSIEGDRAKIDIRWTRDVKRPGFSPDDSVERRATLTLREDDARPIDLITVLPEAAVDCGWYVVELGYQRIDPPEVADARLDYDLWLVHTEPDGRQVTERIWTSGNQGAQVDFRFAPVPHGTDGTPLEAYREVALSTTFSGEIRGRARPDGLLDVTVRVERWLSMERGTGGSGGVVTGAGVKHLTVQPDETIEIALPSVGGGGQFGLFPDAMFDPGQIFAGQQTAIRLTAKRAR